MEFTIKDIRTDFKLVQSWPQPLLAADIFMGFAWHMVVDPEHSDIQIRSFVQGYTDPSDPVTLFELTAQIDYGLESIQDLVLEGKTIPVPLQVVVDLAGIAYSTMRGALHECLKTTPYHVAILPSMAPNDLLQYQQELAEPQSLLDRTATRYL